MSGATTPRIAIVGGGYAGYALAHQMDAKADVTLIDAREAFVHNVAAIRAIVEPSLREQILFPYDGLLKRGRFVRGRAQAIDAMGVTLADGRRIDADFIVIATGSHYAAPFKPGDDEASSIVGVLAETGKAVAAASHVVIVGAGAVGVELAGEIKCVHPGKQVSLVSSGAQLFPTYRQSLHDSMAGKLRALGVALHLGDGASALGQTDRPFTGDVTLASGKQLSGLIIPAIGARIADSPAFALSGAERRANGQLAVDPWLRPSSLPNVFAIGDLAATGDGMTVVATSRQAPWLARTLLQIASGESIETLKPYKPWPLPPILLPLGPKRGASVLPLGTGLVVGDWMTSAIKGKKLFIPRYRKEFTSAT